MQNDIYLAVIYIAPENSPVHAFYNIDIFQKLQTDITYFKEKGKIFMCGDFNSRTSNKADYVENDRILGFQDDSEDIDIPLQRFSMDRGSNRFGEFLLDLCKAANVRIVNGRLFNDKSIGRVTCTTHNGESVVDYLLTSHENFTELSDFSIHEFNEYSNHAPISFQLRMTAQGEREETRTGINYRWNADFKVNFLNDISRDANNLKESISEEIVRNCDPNDVVSKFSKFISDRANVYVSKMYKHKPETIFFSQVTQKYRNRWFNDECKRKNEAYKKAVYEFNIDRNDYTRSNIFKMKKYYKYFCRSCKLKYNREQGQKFRDLKRKHPREFWGMFKRQQQHGGNNISLQDFHDYFQALASDAITQDDIEIRENLNLYDNNYTDSTNQELDEPITQTEIKNAINV